jgi:hypothetical protein
MILLKNLIKNYLLAFHGTFIHQIMPIIKINSEIMYKLHQFIKNVTKAFELDQNFYSYTLSLIPGNSCG